MNKIILEDLQRMDQCSFIDWRKLFGKKVLITGAYGMLASYMVYMLLFLNRRYGAGISIFAMGRRHDRFVERFSAFLDDKDFHIVEHDVVQALPELEAVDYIIHAASPASPHFYGTKPVDVILPNVIGCNNMLNKAVSDKVDGFLFVSSGPYGNLEGKVESIRETDMGRLDPMNIRSCYDESKRCGETLCLSYFYQYGVPINCVRPSHTYGPTMDLNDSRVFANFVSDVVHGRNIEIKGDGRAKRSFCYITDAVLGYYKVLLDAPRGEAYNVGNDEANISISDLAKMLTGLFPEKSLGVEYRQRAASDRYVNSPIVESPILNTEKIRSLGWKWSVSLEQGFKRTVDSFLQG